jgi:anti-sigma factor RsiW
MHPDLVSDAEIAAYLDGELDLPRTLAVEDHLARNPDAAARFMADRCAQTSLRLLSHDLGSTPQTLSRSAARLSRKLEAKPRGMLRLAFSGIAAGALALVAAGAMLTLRPSVAEATPAYVGDAVMAYQTGLLRAAMISQIESPRFDAREIQRSTKIRMPKLPTGWTITDAQIFPSDDGPALQLMIRTSTNEEISIFAVHAASAAPRSPRAIRHGKASVAYWRVGEMSYALTGMDVPEALDLAAEDLATEHDS